MAVASAKLSVQRLGRRLDKLEADGAPDSALLRGVNRLVAACTRLGEREQVSIPETGRVGVAVSDAEGVSQPAGAALAPAHTSLADSLTPEMIDSLTWDEVGELYGDLGDDPEACERLELLVDEREARERAASGEAVPWQDSPPPFGGGDLITNPTLRPSRKLTPHEVAREEYDAYVYSQYARCESELSFMLNKQGQAKGVDTFSLFSGPVSRVKKYGSDELQAWFALNGRHTLGSFRHGLFGWASDFKAARHARLEGFDNVAHVV